MFDFKDIALKAIHDIGGCDAADEYARGYDDGVNAAYAAVQSLASEDQRIEALARYYGFTSQANMLTEEAAEFTVALNKLRRGSSLAYGQIKEETADNLVIALQLRVLLGPEDIDKIMEEKIQRQLGRIHEADAWAYEQYKKFHIKIEDPSLNQRFINDFNKDKLTTEFWERKVNEPPTDKCIIEEDWAKFGEQVKAESSANAEEKSTIANEEEKQV